MNTCICLVFGAFGRHCRSIACFTFNAAYHPMSRLPRWGVHTVPLSSFQLVRTGLLSQLSKHRHRVSQPANDGAHHSTQLQLKLAWFILVVVMWPRVRFGADWFIARRCGTNFAGVEFLRFLLVVVVVLTYGTAVVACRNFSSTLLMFSFFFVYCWFHLWRYVGMYV